MEDSVKEQSSISEINGGKSAKLLRYPLRSASKPSPSIVSAPKRGKSTSGVSQSVSVLDLSTKEKSAAKPPRRLSIPSKPPVSPAPNSVGYNTPISEARTNRVNNLKAKSQTPGSDVSRSLNRKKFTVLSSASYWLSHIKLSEAAGKHQLSLGFFKLALEACCENVQLLRDELKSYACKHNLVDLGDSAKEVFQSYEILETIEQLQVSETCSHVTEEDDSNSLSSTTQVSKPKPKPRSLNNISASSATQKSNPVSRIKAPMSKKTALETGNGKMQRNSKKINKQESKKEKPVAEEAELDACSKEAVVEENKENMNAMPVEELSLEA